MQTVRVVCDPQLRHQAANQASSPSADRGRTKLDSLLLYPSRDAPHKDTNETTSHLLLLCLPWSHDEAADKAYSPTLHNLTLKINRLLCFVGQNRK